MRRMQSLLVLALMTLPLLAQEQTLRIQPVEGAKLSLIVEKTRLMSGKKHQFTWSRYEGSLRFDQANPANSMAVLIIEAGSLECHDTWVSESDLRKIQEFARKNMLGLPEHSQIRFASKEVVPSGDGYQVAGDLTIRGIAKPVMLQVRLIGNGASLWIEGEGAIRLTDYGLKPPSAALGTVGTRDQMTLTFRVLAGPI